MFLKQTLLLTFFCEIDKYNIKYRMKFTHIYHFPLSLSSFRMCASLFYHLKQTNACFLFCYYSKFDEISFRKDLQIFLFTRETNHTRNENIDIHD